MGNNYNPQDELREIEADISIMKQQIAEHLSKFKDLDLLFKKAKLVIQKYFEEQNKYKEKNAFIQYLKEELIFYVNSFKLTREERKPINDKLDYIEETYSDLIYFGQFNPVKARIGRLKAEEVELNPKTKGVIGWMKGVVGKIVGNK